MYNGGLLVRRLSDQKKYIGKKKTNLAIHAPAAAANQGAERDLFHDA
jgi:hypothetical protein